MFEIFFVNDLWNGILPFDLKQFFKLFQLLLKAHVWKNHWSFLAGKLKGLIEFHVFLLHQKSNDASRRAADACMAMNQYATLTHSFLNEGYSGRKMANERRAGYIEYFNHLVFEILQI